MKLIHTIFFLLISSSAFSQIEDLFKNEAAFNHFNGVVLVKKGNEIQYADAFGNASKQDINTLNTRFDIGSISKQFTSAGILHLVEKEQLSLDGKINDYLGKYASDKWDKVTIHHLLNHTSGIPSIYQTEQGLEIFFPEESKTSLEALIDKFSDGKLLKKPGKEFNYSNSGYILLAAIIEQISGKPYIDFMQSEIFDKYDLKSTSFTRGGVVANPYYGYLPIQQREAPIYHSSWLIGAGGIYSTVEDLSKWIGIITSEGFMTKELKSKFLNPQTENNYGYGWQFSRNGIVQHDGGNAGFISFISFKPESKEHHIMLTNQSFEQISDFDKSANKIRFLSDQIWKWRKGEEIDIHPERSFLKTDTTSFQLEDGQIIKLVPENDYAYVQVTEQSPLRIVPSKELKGDNGLEEKLMSISSHLENNRYWKFAGYCNWEMKIVAYTGLMRIGFGQMKDQVGGLVKLIPYSINDRHGLIRMVGNDSILDLIAYFDEQGKLNGLFEHGGYDLIGPKSVISYPVKDNKIFMDGFPYGELSATLEIGKDTLRLSQFNRTIEAVRIK